MRWNCPHCEEQVTAEIDFTSTKEAYVQCEPCGGMAILHRGAMTTKIVTQTITKTVLVTPPQAPVATQTVTPPSAPIQAAAPEMVINTAPEITLEAVATPEAITAPEAPVAVPPPFRAPRTEASSYPKPPAFLLKPSNETPKPLETVETFVEPPRTAGKSMFSNIAVWFAVITATTSGVYLYTQVKATQISGVKQILAAVTRR